MTKPATKQRGGDTRAAATRNGRRVGRPAKNQEAGETVVIATRVEPDLKEFAVTCARAQGLSLSDYLRCLILREEIDSRII